MTASLAALFRAGAVVGDADDGGTAFLDLKREFSCNIASLKDRISTAGHVYVARFFHVDNAEETSTRGEVGIVPARSRVQGFVAAEVDASHAARERLRGDGGAVGEIKLVQRRNGSIKISAPQLPVGIKRDG